MKSNAETRAVSLPKDMELVSIKIVLLWCFSLAVMGWYITQSSRPDSRFQEPSTSGLQQPPQVQPTPAEDTARYVAWMKQQGKPITDKPHEDVSLRFGDWGFFYHGDRPVGSFTPLRDRMALDRSGHAVTNAETSDWYALLSTNGIAANQALQRVAWLFDADGLENGQGPGSANRNKISTPSLNTRDGVITFQGSCEAHTDPPYEMRITIVATATGAKLVKERIRR